LAKQGLDATIEDLASQAQVSPATIYNHFESKDAILKEALNQIWQEWVDEAYAGRPEGQDLATMFEVCRKLFRVDSKKTLLGQVLSQTFEDSTFVIDAIRSSGAAPLKQAVQKSGLGSDDFETRLDMWSYCLVGIFHGIYVTNKLSPQDADNALRISLSIWNLNKTQAEKLTSKPISA
jgi:AcrR family transcriptional regulator